MDVDELYLDLLALRELYILLLKSCLRDENSELLNERAKILLKHLLDDATTGVLEFLSKDLATKPLDHKVIEWMKHNQTSRKMENSKIDEHNIPKRKNRTSVSSNVSVNDLSHGITSTLRTIELHILSLQHCTTQNRKTANDYETLRSRFTKPIKGRGQCVGKQKVKLITTPEFVHGFRIPMCQTNDGAMKPPTIDETHKPKEQHKVVNPMTVIDKSKVTFKPAMKLNQISIQLAKKKQNSYHQMVIGPTLLDHHHLSKETDFTNSEFQSPSSSSPSTWTTQQTTESETVNDDDYYSSSLSHEDNRSTTGSKSSSRTMSTKLCNIKQGKKESKLAIGRFKKLKDKLGVIFHHHHHHHHHHDNRHNNFMWEQLKKIFHHRDNKRVLVSKEDRNEKVKKRAIRNVCEKNQVGKFQVLADGLRRHVWRSKAMKMKKKKKRKKKGVKKLQWWKMFRRGVKLPNKGRMKIGYVNKKP